MARLFDEKAFLESLLGLQQTPRFNSYASFPYQESVGKAVNNDFNRKLSAGNVNQVDKQKEEAWNMEQYKKLFGDTMKTQGVDYQKLANDYAKDLNATNMSDTMNPYSTSYKMLQNEKATQNVLDESLARQVREKAERLAAEQAEKDRVAALTYNGGRDNTGSYRHPATGSILPAGDQPGYYIVKPDGSQQYLDEDAVGFSSEDGYFLKPAGSAVDPEAVGQTSGVSITPTPATSEKPASQRKTEARGMSFYDGVPSPIVNAAIATPTLGAIATGVKSYFDSKQTNPNDISSRSLGPQRDAIAEAVKSLSSKNYTNPNNIGMPSPSQNAFNHIVKPLSKIAGVGGDVIGTIADIHEFNQLYPNYKDNTNEYLKWKTMKMINKDYVPGFGTIGEDAT